MCHVVQIRSNCFFLLSNFLQAVHSLYAIKSMLNFSAHLRIRYSFDIKGWCIAIIHNFKIEIFSFLIGSGTMDNYSLLVFIKYIHFVLHEELFLNYIPF